MEERASGIILRTRPLTETSLIVQLITPEQGRLAVVAKGARRPKSPFSGKLDLFYEVAISFSRSRKSELHNLREVILREVHSALRTDLSRLNAAAYGAVLLEYATEAETPIPEFFDLFREMLQMLDGSSPTPSLVFAFEVKVLALIGATPAAETLPPVARQLFEAWRSLPLDAAGKLPLPEPALIEAILRRSIGVALERLPPQRARLLESLRA
jgi:DNA repair protein RecO (recombination protein O)